MYVSRFLWFILCVCNYVDLCLYVSAEHVVLYSSAILFRHRGSGK